MKAADSTMSYLELLKLASPETIVVITALAVLSIGLVTGRVKSTATVSTAKPAQSANDTSTATGICSAVAAFGLAVAIGTVLMLPRHATLFSGMLVITPLTSLFKIICIALAFFTVLLTTSEKSLRHPGEYLALVLFATVGLMLLVGSEELLMIFIGLELLGLSLYVMTAFDKTDVRSAEAGLKYFLFGSTSSAFTLFGISLIYGMSGTTSLAAVSEKLATVSVQPLLAVGIVMTLIGFAFKIAAAPFHLWAPDAYQGAPVPSSAFIASASKVASLCWSGLLLFTAAPHGMRWLQVGPPCSPRWQHYRYCLEISSRLRNQMCADCLPTPRWRMLDIHSLDWSLAIAPDFPPHYFTPPSMLSHSSVHSASSPWCGAKLAATISQTLPD